MNDLISTQKAMELLGVENHARFRATSKSLPGFPAPVVKRNGASSTTWRKGNRPHNHRPIGSERLSKDGYIEVKTAEPRTWTAKSRVIWERENGPLPDGYAVIFLDGNARNFEPSNLYAVKRRELLQLNRNKYGQAHPKLKPSVLALSKLESALHVASK